MLTWREVREKILPAILAKIVDWRGFRSMTGRTFDPQVTRVLLNRGARLNQPPLIFSKALH